MRVCRDCGSDSDFSSEKAVRCRPCIRKRNRDNYVKNQELRKQQAKLYRNSPEGKRSSKEYREKNRDRLRRYEANRQRDPEERRLKAREYRRSGKASEAQRRRYRRKRQEILAMNDARSRRSREGLSERDIRLSNLYRTVIESDPCHYCGHPPGSDLQVDHYVPIAKGGKDYWWNLVRACRDCNLQKSDQDPVDFQDHNGSMFHGGVIY